jgi:phosphopantothenoylcysteine decarboxylase/phosphopantothenate--cysteine ligase
MTQKKLTGISGKKILISAGPMRTDLDPVRFIQNRSSGKMGLALARACKDFGAASVTILLGPVSTEIQKALSEFTVKDYKGPSDYEKSLDELFPKCDVFFSAAAVLDFETLPPDKKIERAQLAKMQKLEIAIRPVPDIIAKFGAKKTPEQKVIAFAAESGTEAEILARAEKKMLAKSADAMIANPVWEGLGPDSDENQVWILKPGHKHIKIGPAPKSQLGHPILEAIFGSH